MPSISHSKRIVPIRWVRGRALELEEPASTVTFKCPTALARAFAARMRRWNFIRQVWDEALAVSVFEILRGEKHEGFYPDVEKVVAVGSGQYMIGFFPWCRRVEHDKYIAWLESRQVRRELREIEDIFGEGSPARSKRSSSEGTMR